MDETTEPLVAVIGHPIAGHPAQFALEKAFVHLNLDYRVISFDVDPPRLSAALDGVDVLQFRGVYLDHSVRAAASSWCQTHQNDSPPNALTHPSGEEKTDSPRVPSVAHSDTTSVASETTTIDAGVLPNSDSDWIDPEIRSRSSAWLDTTMDCLFRSEDPHLPFVASQQEHDYLIGRVREFFVERGCKLETLLLLGERGARANSPPSRDRIAESDLIVIPARMPSASPVSTRRSSSSPTSLGFDQWPESDKLVIDFSDQLDVIPREDPTQVLSQRGYTVIAARERLIGCLAGCVLRWTGDEIPHEVLADAVEEYTAV